MTILTALFLVINWKTMLEETNASEQQLTWEGLSKALVLKQHHSQASVDAMHG
jgi:hypothetical protein